MTFLVICFCLLLFIFPLLWLLGALGGVIWFYVLQPLWKSIFKHKENYEVY